VTEKLNPTQQRALTDAEGAGDKAPGFDPAAAPAETDAEAGGAPTPAMSQPTRASSNPNEVDPAKTPSGGKSKGGVGTLGVVLLILAGLALSVSPVLISQFH
jgi:hypothetical protein